MTPSPDAGGPVLGPPADNAAIANGAPSLRDRVRSLRLDEKRKTGRSAPVWLLPWGLCVIMLGMTAAFGYRAYKNPPAPADNTAVASADSGSSAGPGTSAGVASTGDLALLAKGYIIAAHQIQVSPEVGGRLEWLDETFEEGRFFPKGKVLARIENTDYQADVQNARNSYTSAKEKYEETLTSRPEEIAQAEADLAEAQANADTAKKKLERTSLLLKTHATQQEDYELDQAASISAEKKVNRMEKALELMKKAQRTERQLAAKADMEAAAALLRKAEWRLSKCEIQAPVSGIILTKKAEKGNYVNPVAFNVSASLCDMADLTDLEVDVKIQERDIARVKENQVCTVMPEAYQGDEAFLQVHPHGYDGRVSRPVPT
ncbi:MAG: efflux RND transporter periplasmic adaptor subunit, partial [Planctomycetes bacterium]|nr:efflux RND transporter periplasmic adaptor subunit [Planctomycetota bacterium]